MSESYLHTKKYHNIISNILEEFFSSSAAVQVADVDAYPISDAELTIVSGAVEKRQREFSSGRWCAHRALTSLDVSCPFIGVGKLCQPLWPNGIIGAISHDYNLCAAVVIPELAVPWINIGIDIINLDEKKNNLTGMENLIIFNQKELQLIATELQQKQPEIVLFSLKECAVKALSKFSGQFMDFRELCFMKTDSQYFCRYMEVSYRCEVLVKKIDRFLVTAIKIYPSQKQN